jgi:hypothetical protein
VGTRIDTRICTRAKVDKTIELYEFGLQNYIRVTETTDLEEEMVTVVDAEAWQWEHGIEVELPRLLIVA